MLTPYQSIEIRWSTGSSDETDLTLNAAYPDQDIQWFQYPIEPEVGTGGFVSIKLHSGMSVHRSTFQFQDGVRPEATPRLSVKIRMHEKTLMIQSVLTGRVNRLSLGDGSVDELTAGRTLLLADEGHAFTLILDSKDPIEILYLHASESSLAGLMGEDLASDLLRRIQDYKRRAIKLPKPVLAPLRFCLDDQLSGALHKLNAQTKVLEFLTGLLRHLEGLTRSRPLAREGRAAAVKSHIEQTGLSCPSVPELAKLFGLTTKTINAAFTEAYGMTVTRFIKERRLASAHELLQNSQLPLKEICAQLGYSQVSNFSNAFKDFFGYSPTTLRQKTVPKALNK
jgi:AraC-like DNA-binding protein